MNTIFFFCCKAFASTSLSFTQPHPPFFPADLYARGDRVPPAFPRSKHDLLSSLIEAPPFFFVASLPGCPGSLYNPHSKPFGCSGSGTQRSHNHKVLAVHEIAVTSNSCFDAHSTHPVATGPSPTSVPYLTPPSPSNQRLIPHSFYPFFVLLYQLITQYIAVKADFHDYETRRIVTTSSFRF